MVCQAEQMLPTHEGISVKSFSSLNLLTCKLEKKAMRPIADCMKPRALKLMTLFRTPGCYPNNQRIRVPAIVWIPALGLLLLL